MKDMDRPLIHSGSCSRTKNKRREHMTNVSKYFQTPKICGRLWFSSIAYLNIRNKE